MEIPLIQLSDSDKDLLESHLKVEHPSVFSPLIERVPSNTEGMQIAAGYNIRDDDVRRWASCAACHRRENHKKGLVLFFPDGSYAALGRACGEKKHGLEYELLIRLFDERSERADSLRRVATAAATIPSIIAFLQGLPNLPQVKELEDLRRGLEHQFRKLYLHLASSGGQLFLPQVVTDNAEMAERRKRRDRKIDRLAKQLGQNEVTLEFATAHYRGDPDFSRDDLKVQQDRLFTSYTGVALFKRVPNLDREMNSLVQRIIRSIEVFDGVSTDRLADGAIAGSVTKFRVAIRAAMKLVDDLNKATTFFSTQNLTEIARWANLRPEIKTQGTFSVGRGYISHEFRSGPPLKLEFPEVLPQISSGLLKSALDSVRFDAGEEALEDDEANVA